MAELGGVDTSIYKPQAQSSMLDRASSAAGLLNAVQQNRLISSQADLAKVNTVAAHIDFIRSLVTARLQQKTPITKDQLNSDARKGIAAGAFTAAEWALAVPDIPDDPNKIRDMLESENFALLDASQKIAATKAQIAVDTGSGTLLGNYNLMAGRMTPGTFVSKTISPETATTPIETVEGGKKVFRTRAQIDAAAGNPIQPPTVTQLDQTGAPADSGAVAAASAAMGGSGAAPPPTPDGTVAPGDMPATDQPPPPPARTTGAAPDTSGTNPAAADFGPGVSERYQNMADNEAALRTAASAAKQAHATLDNMKVNLKNFSSGPFAEWMMELKSAWNQISPSSDLTFDPSALKDQAEFRKQAIQVALQMANSVAGGGAGTDALRSLAESANPNELLQNMSNDEIIDMLKGNLDAVIVKNDEWLKYLKGKGAFGDGQQHTVQDFADFENQFNHAYDPRVFQMQYMTAAERKDYLDSLPDQSYNDLMDATKASIHYGWVKAPKG